MKDGSTYLHNIITAFQFNSQNNLLIEKLNSPMKLKITITGISFSTLNFTTQQFLSLKIVTFKEFDYFFVVLTYFG